MSNDRAFAAYGLILIAGVASVITASVMAGVATLPSAFVFLEHLALSLLFRTAYKSFGGFDWLLPERAVGATVTPLEADVAVEAEGLDEAA